MKKVQQISLKRTLFFLGGSTVLLVAIAGRGSAYAATSAAQPQATAAVEGQVVLMNRRGTRPARSVSALDVMVFFEPAVKPAKSSSTNGVNRYEMATVDKTYTPHVLAVPAGQPVHFPNRDRILHNVFSVSGSNRFDLDLVGPGESASHTFEEAGLVRVFCNVHRDMVGYLWVLDTPYAARPTADGRFMLTGVPRGKGTLTIWHERADPLEVQVDTQRPGGVGTIELMITRPRLPSHARKDGSAYRVRETY